MKFTLSHLVLLSSLFLFACSTLSSDYTGNNSVSANDAAALKVKNESASLPPKVLFELLVAEIALKRGEIEVALDNYMQAARDTGDADIARRATRIAEFSQSNIQALEAAQLWVKIDPESKDAQQALVILLLRAEKLELAAAKLDVMLDTLDEEEQSVALMQLVGQLSRERNKDTGVGLLDLMTKKKADSAFVHFALGHLNMRLNQFEAAIIAVDNSLELKQDWLEAIVLRGRILQLQNKVEEAISYYQQEISKGSAESVNLRISLARMLMDVKRLDEAREQYVILAELDPESSDLTYAAGLLSLQAEKIDDAEKYFTKLHEKKERQIEASYYLGQVEESRDHMDKAVAWYSKVHRGELYIDAQMRIAALLSKQKLFDKAITRIRSIRANTSRDKLKLYLLEGDVVLEAGRYQDAFDIYDRALLDMPDDSNLLYARALAAEKINRLDILENDLLSILKVEPNNVQALNALGYTLADKTDRYDEALRFIKRALALEPKDAAIVDSMGWVHYRMGKHQEALAYLQHAMEIIGDVEIAAHFGEVLWVTNKKDEAIKIWNKMLIESPNNKVILDVMRRFGL